MGGRHYWRTHLAADSRCRAGTLPADYETRIGYPVDELRICPSIRSAKLVSPVL